MDLIRVVFFALLTLAILAGAAAIFLPRHRLALAFAVAFFLGGITGLGWLIIFGVLP